MAYIGKTPTIGNFQVCDAISVVNNQAAYTMQVGGVNVSPESSQHMIVSLNGVIQKNGGTNPSFTVSGSTITFASNLVTNDVIDFIQILGNVLDLGVPSDSTVSLAKLTATGTKNSTTFLRGDNTFNAPPLGGITMADQWRRTAAMTITSTAQVLSANWEQVDTSGQGTIGSSMTQSSGVFSFPTTGLYFITVNQNFYDNDTDSRYFEFKIDGTVNNSSYTTQSRMTSSLKYISSNTYSMLTCNTFFNVTNTSNCKIRFKAESQNDTTIGGDTAFNESQSYTFIRLGDSV